MYDIISAFQCYTISVDVYFPFHCTLWMACFTFLLILCYCCCAHDNDVSHTLHREWGVTQSFRVSHIFREGNAPADILANWSIHNKVSLTFEDQRLLPKEARGAILLDKQELPGL